jgi:transglutaminase-like putative cysteine protease
MKVKRNAVHDYLKVTEMCDHDDRWLLQLAEEIVEGATTSTEQAINVFYHVRDRVRFGISYSRSKASETLKRGYGDCVSKTNVHVALLRAVGIPARFRRAKVEKVTLHRLISELVYKQMPPTVSHFWPECWLNERWISCEAFLDKPLYEGMLRRGMITREQVRTIDWDGKTDLIVLEAWIAEHLGTLASAEEAIATLQTAEEGMPPLWVEKMIAPLFFPFNLRYSDRIRQSALGDRADEFAA